MKSETEAVAEAVGREADESPMEKDVGRMENTADDVFVIKAADEEDEAVTIDDDDDEEASADVEDDPTAESDPADPETEVATLEPLRGEGRSTTCPVGPTQTVSVLVI